MIDEARKIITRDEARALGLTRYFTGNECVRGHVAERNTGNRSCVECSLAHSKAYRERNPDKIYEYCKGYVEKNREWSRENARKDREKNKEARIETTRAWRAQNIERQNYYSAKRYAMKRSQVPEVRADLVPFLHAETLAIYAEARTITELTGIRHDVDHIFPLSKGGVHAPWNLRVLLGSENQSKKDKWPKGEPTHVMWHGELMSRLIG